MVKPHATPARAMRPLRHRRMSHRAASPRGEAKPDNQRIDLLHADPFPVMPPEAAIRDDAARTNAIGRGGHAGHDAARRGAGGDQPGKCSFASVRDCNASNVTPGAMSSTTKPRSVMSITARLV